MFHFLQITISYQHFNPVSNQWIPALTTGFILLMIFPMEVCVKCEVLLWIFPTVLTKWHEGLIFNLRRNGISDDLLNILTDFVLVGNNR